MDLNSLDYIACAFGTDKSTRSFLPQAEGGYAARPEQGHGYTIYYEHYLGQLRSRPIRLLEIGVLDGKSLATWGEYFPEAVLYGLDIDPYCARFENDRTKIFIGSQADAAVLDDIRQEVPEGFDVVIDDGSHYVKHVIASFSQLFDQLRPGGTYVIEDLHVAACHNWGQVSFNQGMDLEKDSRGNDPDEMVRFLTDVRGRKDVAELVVHLKKICFIRKSSSDSKELPSPWERGDRLQDLFPRPQKKTFMQKVAVHLLGQYEGS